MEHQELKNPERKTKNVIIAAYNDAIAELRSKTNGHGATSTVAVAEANKISHAIATAGEVDVDVVVQALATISDDIKGAKEEYDQLNTAIAAKKKELEDVHGLVQETDSTFAIVAAKDRLVAERQERAEKIIDDANVSAAEIKAEADEYARKIRNDIKEEREAENKERDRLVEEWNYNFNRRKQKDQDKLSDEIAAKNKELEIREDALVSRELEADDIQKKFEGYEATIKQMEANTDSLIAAAVEKAKASEEKSFNISKSIITKEFEGQINVLKSEKAGLIQQLEDLKARLERAENAVSNANDRATSIATNALRAGADAATVAKIGEIAAGSGGKGK